jgi:hypothetical protein
VEIINRHSNRPGRPWKGLIIMTRSNRAGYRRNQPGKASNYIKFCDLKPGDKAVLCIRVSRWEQNRTLKLKRQELNLRAAVEHMGAIVVAVEAHVGPGWDPGWLVRPAAIATRHGAVLVAETTSRFIRSSAYSKTNQDAQAREPELIDLRRCTEGVTLMTILDPDALPGEERAYQTKRGLKIKSATQPGYKKLRYLRCRSKVRDCAIAGITGRPLAKELKVPESTARAWVRRLCAEQ